MKVFRALLAAVIILNLGLLAVYHPFRTTSLRYACARKRLELRSLALENRTLLLGVACARRPDSVAGRAAAFGLDLRTVENDCIDRVAKAPRR